MAKDMKKIVSVGILIVIVGLFAYYIGTHISDFKELRLVNPVFLVVIGLLGVVGCFTSGLVIKYLLEPFGIKIKIKEWFGLSAISNFYNTITPFRGGVIARAVYLKKRYKFAYTDFIASLAGIYILNFFVASVIGLIGLWLIYKIYGIFNIIVLIALLGCFVVFGGITFFSRKVPEQKNKWVNRFVRVLNGWNLIRNHKKIVFVVLIVSLIQFIINSVSLIINYHVIGVDLPFDKAIFLVAISTLGSILQITPGNLGVAEAISVFSSTVVGITPAQSLSVAVIGRAIGTIVVIILGVIFSYVLMKAGPKKVMEEGKELKN